MRRVDYTHHGYQGGSTSESREVGGGLGASVSGFVGHIPSASYVQVSPNRTTNPFGSWPCEQMAASVNNRTSLAILNEQYDEVCARLMQSKKNKKLFKRIAILEGMFVCFNLFLLSIIQNRAGALRSGALASALLVSAVPHLCVARQFERLQQRCEGILRARFGDSFVKEVNGLSRNELGFQKVIELLEGEGCTTDFLTKKLEVLQRQAGSSSWLADSINNLNA